MYYLQYYVLHGHERTRPGVAIQVSKLPQLWIVLAAVLEGQ